MAKNTRTTTLTKKSAQEHLHTRPTGSWVTRVNAGLKLRAEGEKVIADALRERLDKVGEARWLKEVESEWGWSRTTAYRHLNPELLQKDRDRAAAARSDGRNVETIEPETVSRSSGHPAKPCCGSTRWEHTDACPKGNTGPSAVPPMDEQRRLIAEAKDRERLVAEPFTPEYESEIGDGWLKTLIETFEKTAADLAGSEKVLRRLGSDGRARMRTAAQAVLDALDPKAVTS